MAVGIYKLVDRITGETLWVGQSVNLESRHRRHLNDLKHGRHSQQSFADWYIESERTSEDILMETLQICEPEDLNLFEGIWFAQDPPRFYGQMPSATRKWYLSAETRVKMSQSHITRIRLAKEAGVFVSSWDAMSVEDQLKKAIKNKESGFDSARASEAARKGNAGRTKSLAQREKASAAAKLVAKEILICTVCERECKGKSALGRHMTVHS